MSVKEEEYLREKQKLDKTRKYIVQEIKESEERLERGFEDYDFDDYSDDYMKAALKDRFNQRIKNLKMIEPKPYFARVDFVEDGSDKRDAFYLGKTFVTDHETLEQIVIDWRAPIADLYYEGRLGDAEYDCPEGMIKGEIKLKRQYFFKENGNLENLLDIDITTNDEMLQPFLAAASDTRLKNIVATIQAEQNKIIRADMWKPLIVQGVAGSGKTTIALHRIAYLIYNYEKRFYPEEFLIIAPNKFFLNYISNVLPDLGVDRVGQMTYEEIAFDVIGKVFDIADPNEKLSFMIKNSKTEKEKRLAEIIEKTSTVKSSVRFKNMLDEYIFEIEKNFIPEEDFIINDHVFMDKNQLHYLFSVEYGNLPLCRRVEELSKHLYNAVTMKSGELLREYEEDCAYQISKAKFKFSDSTMQQSEIRRIYDERDAKIKAVTKDAKKNVQKYFKENKVLEPLQYYKDFLNHYLAIIAKNRMSEEEIQYIKNEFHKYQLKGKIEMEDIAPLMYLKYRIHGIKTKFDLKHIVVDEAQDFSEFQFYVFKQIVKSNSLTILGDLSQGIYYYRGTQNWQKTMSIVFGPETDIEYLTLSKTYRTTEEIMNTANKIISHLIDKLNCPLGEPVMKNGAPVTIKKFDNEKEMVVQIVSRLTEFKNNNLKNIAIIGKTVEDCEKLKELIGMDEIHIISDSDSEYSGGISIVPSYLSKGLEFDAVIITNADVYHYTMSEADTKLLYVCCTRAMSQLDIYHIEELTELLQ
ncbi:MAG: UvrD-helicase domain-containing protein [Clostridia bacterium]|nr:UvrD-helicase domain-containing protein [Clostridia bacterium]